MGSEDGDIERHQPLVQYLSLVREVAADAAAQADPDLCLRHLRSGLIRLGFVRAGIWVTDPDDPTLVQGTWGTDWDGSEVDEHGVTQTLSALMNSNPFAPGARLFSSRRVRSADPTVPAHLNLKLSDGPPNQASVALRADGTFLGMISVDMLPGDRTIDPEQLAALDLVANARGRVVASLGTALERERTARLEAEEHEKRASFLADASQQFSTSLDVEASLRSFSDLVVPTLADYSFIDLLSPAGTIKRVAVSDPDRVRAEQIWNRERQYPIDPAGPHVVARVIRTGRSEMYSELPDALLAQYAHGPDDLDAIRRGGMSSVMVVPLAARGNVFGAVTLMGMRADRHFGPTDLALAEDLVSRLALRIDNNQLYAAEIQAREDAETARQEIIALYEATKQITASIDLATTLGSILDAVIKLSGSSTAGIALLDDTRTDLTMEAARGQFADSIQGVILSPNGVTGSVAASGEMYVSPDLHQDRRWIPTPGLIPAAIRSGLFVPLKVGEIVIGVMTAWSEQVGYFSLAHQRLLRGFSEQAALAVERGRDLTRRKQSEEALRHSEEYFRLLIERSTDVIVILNSDSTVRYASPQGHLVFGIPQGSMVGHDVLAMVHPDDLTGCRVFLASVADTPGVGFSHHFRARHANGTWRWIDASGINFLAEQAVAGIVISLRNVTEQHHLEEELRQSQKMEAIGQLAGGIAHDFNNLLTVICGYGELLLEQLSPGSSERAEVEQIVQAGDSAASLTRQLLAFSRRQVIALNETDLNTVVEQISKMLRRLIGEDVTYATILTPNLGHILADLGQIEQVLLNLATNSRDAMPRGGTFTIETANADLTADYARQHSDAQPGPHVMVAVSDTGTGMDPEIQSRIFEPFFTTKEVGRGTGLGLAAVYGIVRQSGGSIDVVTEMGKGTTFKLYFPRVNAPAQTVAVAVDRIISPPRTETVLLVEDEKRVRDLARLSLELAGFSVIEADGGERALQIARDYPEEIHLVVTDVVMPGMSGSVVAERLIQLRPDLRVLYVSGYTDDVVIRNGVIDAGFDFLQKPFTPMELVSKVGQLLDLSRPRR